MVFHDRQLFAEGEICVKVVFIIIIEGSNQVIITIDRHRALSPNNLSKAGEVKFEISLCWEVLLQSPSILPLD